ncbi:hypothetical protein ABIA35_004201 [Catenulispora sp. MAP12-49]|uniref:hypothetical protein n=1 Tax=Catenulispora sp. MAP12-49 TaxID=3156302 RepID=UPI003514698A
MEHENLPQDDPAWRLEPTLEELAALINLRLDYAAEHPNEGACMSQDDSTNRPFPTYSYMRRVMMGEITETPIADTAAARALCLHCPLPTKAECARIAERSTDTARFMGGMAPVERVNQFGTNWLDGTWSRHFRTALIARGVREAVADMFVEREHADLAERIAALKSTAS